MVGDLGKEVVERVPEELLSGLLFERVPFIFGESWKTYRAWRFQMAAAIKVDPSEVIVVGSAAVGQSLSPNRNLAAFGSESDVDIAVVSDRFFSEAWHHLRTVDLTLDALSPAQRLAVTDHRTKYIYWGCIATDRLLPILPFAKEWLTARSMFQGKAPFMDRELNFRIYKDFRALRGYQLGGLLRLRTNLLSKNAGA